MSDDVAASVIVRTHAGSLADEEAADMVKMLTVCLGQGLSVKVHSALEGSVLPNETGYDDNYFSPMGTQLKLSGGAPEDEGLLELMRAVYEDEGIYFSSDSSYSFPTRSCKADEASHVVSFKTLQEFDDIRSKGGFGDAPDPALDAVRMNVASCGEEAQCGGTLGPVCIVR